ncbi:MAG: hypothetical protein PF485_02100 [Bacteroidales bacterium]|jgi:hypothetical protein|nr:hypothetical protein [Bacteroidales bacterium]
MDQKKVRALLEKFYNGETTLNEEKILREYFSNELIDSKFVADKDVFLYQVQENENLKSIPDMSNEIWNNLNNNKDHKIKTNNNLTYFYLRIAASIIILIGSFFLLKNQVFNKQQNIQFTDSYDNPEIAYQQAKEALLYVSAVLNTGAEHLEPIAKLDIGTQNLNKLSYIDKGLKELDPINKYNIADKYFKQ